MDINMVHWYSHIKENLLCLIYDSLGVNLTSALQVCDSCARSKIKARAVRNKIYKRASNPGERISVDTTSPLLEILIGNLYWIFVVGDYTRYYSCFFKNKKSQLLKKMGELFEKWRHMLLQLSTYVVIMPDSTNQNCRRCVKNKI